MATATISPSTNTLGNQIADSLKSAGKKGVTVSELVIKTGANKQTITAQLGRLKKISLVKLSGEFRATNGKPSAIYVMTQGVRAIKSYYKPSTTAKPARAPRAKKQQANNTCTSTACGTTAQATTPNGAPIVSGSAPAQPVAPVTKLKNHYILVCDGSGSMQSHAKGASRLFNEQINLVEAAKDQENSMTIFHFGLQRDPSIKEIRFNVPSSMAPKFDDKNPYPVEGNTPLYAAVIKAGQRALCDQDKDKSFVMLVLTDGEENASQNFQVNGHPCTAADLQEFVKTQQATDRWTFVFLVPKGYKDKFVAASGVYEGNVQEWSNIEKAAEDLSRGAVAFQQARRSGKRSSKAWFSTDLSHIDDKIIAQLTDITGETKTWEVDHEQEIALNVGAKTGGTLVDVYEKDATGNVVMENGQPKKLLYTRGAFKGQQVKECQGGEFAPGRAFYELMKKEDKVQDYKRMVLIDKKTKRIYGDGANLTVRAASNFPATGDIAVEPGNHANFVLGIQSTSTNRHLPRGTKVIFWRNGTLLPGAAKH